MLIDDFGCTETVAKVIMFAGRCSVVGLFCTELIHLKSTHSVNIALSLLSEQTRTYYPEIMIVLCSYYLKE